MLNDETIIQLFGSAAVSPTFIEMVSIEKELLFREMIRGRINPVPGVLTWLN